VAVELPFETEIDKADAEPSFLVEVDGFEGPLDLLLELARRQKVDLHKISILALAEQYLLFVEEARRVRLELAADYLVMAAWLAYLKSRLMLPEPPKGEEPAAADLAAALATRLRRLEAIRNVAEQLINRPRFGRDWLLNGAPEGITVQKTAQYKDTIYDLLAAYAKQRQILALSKVTLKLRHVWSIPEARAALERLAGMSLSLEWTIMDNYLLEYCVSPEQRKTVRASAFSASLELVREGVLDLRQDRAFAPIWVRRKIETAASPAGSEPDEAAA
jgi:segregation and condensation protein A